MTMGMADATTYCCCCYPYTTVHRFRTLMSSFVALYALIPAKDIVARATIMSLMTSHEYLIKIPLQVPVMGMLVGCPLLRELHDNANFGLHCHDSNALQIPGSV